MVWDPFQGQDEVTAAAPWVGLGTFAPGAFNPSQALTSMGSCEAELGVGVAPEQYCRHLHSLEVKE